MPFCMVGGPPQAAPPPCHARRGRRWRLLQCRRPRGAVRRCGRRGELAGGAHASRECPLSFFWLASPPHPPRALTSSVTPGTGAVNSFDLTMVETGGRVVGAFVVTTQLGAARSSWNWVPHKCAALAFWRRRTRPQTASRRARAGRGGALGGWRGRGGGVGEPGFGVSFFFLSEVFCTGRAFAPQRRRAESARGGRAPRPPRHGGGRTSLNKQWCVFVCVSGRGRTKMITEMKKKGKKRGVCTPCDTPRGLRGGEAGGRRPP